MSDSYPTIQDALSDVQKEFMGCVEMHLDPPDHDDPTYTVEAVYRLEDDPDVGLPAHEIRFRVAVDETDPEISRRSHAIEFIDSPEEEPAGWVRHVMRRVEAGSGRWFWTESRFEVSAPGIPRGRAFEADVEREVLAFVDKIRLLDRHRHLIELAT